MLPAIILRQHSSQLFFWRVEMRGRPERPSHYADWYCGMREKIFSFNWITKSCELWLEAPNRLIRRNWRNISISPTRLYFLLRKQKTSNGFFRSSAVPSVGSFFLFSFVCFFERKVIKIHFMCSRMKMKFFSFFSFSSSSPRLLFFRLGSPYPVNTTERNFI